ncbi:MAG: DUF1269 domain-containing protein [Gammaproteobacteria bacterium]
MRRRRLYFLLPDVQRARTVFKELLLARIEERHVHVLAREGTALGDLPEATLLQKSDAVHASGLGLVVGGATGAIAGTVVMLFPLSGLAMGLSVVLAMALLGAVMGIWVSGMIGSSTPNTHLEAFREDIERGKVLMIVDVPSDRTDEISRMIRSQHPEADMRGLDPTIPSFP